MPVVPEKGPAQIALWVLSLRSSVDDDLALPIDRPSRSGKASWNRPEVDAVSINPKKCSGIKERA